MRIYEVNQTSHNFLWVFTFSWVSEWSFLCVTGNAKAMLLLEPISGGFAPWLENLELGKLLLAEVCSLLASEICCLLGFCSSVKSCKELRVCGALFWGHSGLLKQLKWPNSVGLEVKMETGVLLEEQPSDRRSLADVLKGPFITTVLQSFSIFWILGFFHVFFLHSGVFLVFFLNSGFFSCVYSEFCCFLSPGKAC